MVPLQLAQLSPYRKTSHAASHAHSKANKAECCIWKCCNCKRQHKFRLHSGKHPAGSFFCSCTHKPCEHCHFAGSLKYFVPIQEPFTIVTPNSDKGEGIPYGVICRNCGVSWRAKSTLPPPKTSTKETKIMRCPTRFLSLPTMSDRAHKRRSLFDFGQVYNTSQSRTKLLIGPAGDTAIRSTEIQFSGLKCSCGSVSKVDTSFCFRIAKDDKSGLGDGQRDPLSYHDGPTIDIRGVRHPNPLRSNPV